MPAKRTSNAAKKGGASRSRSARRAPRNAPSTVVGTVRGDIIGIVLFVALLVWHIAGYRKSRPDQPVMQEA